MNTRNLKVNEGVAKISGCFLGIDIQRGDKNVRTKKHNNAPRKSLLQLRRKLKLYKTWNPILGSPAILNVLVFRAIVLYVETNIHRIFIV